MCCFSMASGKVNTDKSSADAKWWYNGRAAGPISACPIPPTRVEEKRNISLQWKLAFSGAHFRHPSKTFFYSFWAIFWAVLYIVFSLPLPALLTSIPPNHYLWMDKGHITVSIFTTMHLKKSLLDPWAPKPVRLQLVNASLFWSGMFSILILIF